MAPRRSNLQENLRSTRKELSHARAERRARRQHATEQCKAKARVVSERAKQARLALNDAVRLARQEARGFCSGARSQVDRETLPKLERLLKRLGEHRETLRAFSHFAPSSCGTCKVKRSEEEDEVTRNIDDPGLLLVWQKVKHKIKPSARMSRTEAFFQWVHDHPSEVLEIQDRDAEAYSARMMREQPDPQESVPSPFARKKTA